MGSGTLTAYDAAGASRRAASSWRKCFLCKRILDLRGAGASERRAVPTRRPDSEPDALIPAATGGIESGGDPGLRRGMAREGDAVRRQEGRAALAPARRCVPARG